MIEYWPYIVSGFCALVLICMTAALILNKSFRQDMSASEGKANIFNMISIEGAVILSLFALFFFGLIYPVSNPSYDFSKTLTSKGLEKRSASQFIDAYLELEHRHTELRATIEQHINVNDVAQYVKDLAPSDPISKTLFDYPQRELGPWSTLPESKLITVSIPSESISAGSALSCQEFHGKEYDLISALKTKGDKVTVNTDGYIFRSADCHKRVSYDLQISCEDAKRLFTGLILSCDAHGEARWHNKKPEKLAVYLTPSELETNLSMQQKLSHGDITAQ